MVDNDKKLNRLSAVEAITGIKSGRFTSEDLVRSCIEHIEETESNIKAWKYFNKENFLTQAKSIDKKIKDGQKVGVLSGVPVGIKDVFNTKDMPTCMGSPIWEGFTPGNDARVVTYLRWADAIVAGKTATAEFAVHSPAETANPHNLKHTPGTSSSGSAAAVAAFMVPLAIGTQTAGSTIRPASYCGIYGFKPSFGLIPRTGMLKTLDTLDHVTFFSRSVNDLPLLFDLLRVHGPNFPLIDRYLDKPRKEKKSWRVALVKSPAWNYAKKYAQDALFKFAVRISSSKRIKVEDAALPRVFNRAHDIHALIYEKALSYYFSEEYENHNSELSNIFKEMCIRGRKISKSQYIMGLGVQNKLIHALSGFFEKYDIILTLSTAQEAPLGFAPADKPDSCLIWTLCHAPAMNLPVFRAPNNLPFGAQIVSRKYGDYGLLDFAKLLKEEGCLGDWKEN